MTKTPESLADRLLDAQVAFHLDRLSGPRLDATVARLAEDLLSAMGRHPVADLVDVDATKAVVRRALASAPASAVVGGAVDVVIALIHEGPAESFPLTEVVDRERVETLLDELFALTPLLERGLERLTASPLVGVMVSQFMGRIVGEVLAANQAVADRVPGLGSLMSFGTAAASRVVGAADRQLEGLLGDTIGKGGTFAVRRMNRIVVETLRDPTARAAVLEVWDLLAREPVVGLDEHVSREELAGVVDAGHELVIATLAGDRVAQLGDAMVDALLGRFGGHSLTELLDELDVDRADVVADLVRAAPPLVTALRESGDLERIVRAELAPFYASGEISTLLG